MEQVSPDIVLTSSKADDKFTDVLSEHSMSNELYLYAYIHTRGVDASEGTLQIRPHKDFTPSKGRHHILSLRLLAELPADYLGGLSRTDSDLGPETARDAYDFMRRRKEFNGDPDMQRWNAAVRLANFASVEEAPLCVSWMISRGIYAP